MSCSLKSTTIYVQIHFYVDGLAFNELSHNIKLSANLAGVLKCFPNCNLFKYKERAERAGGAKNNNIPLSFHYNQKSQRVLSGYNLMSLVDWTTAGEKEHCPEGN